MYNEHNMLQNEIGKIIFVRALHFIVIWIKTNFTVLVRVQPFEKTTELALLQF